MELLSPYGQIICASSHEGRDHVGWHISLSWGGNKLVVFKESRDSRVAGAGRARGTPARVTLMMILAISPTFKALWNLDSAWVIRHDTASVLKGPLWLLYRQ